MILTNNLTKSTDENVKNENIAFKVKNNASSKCLIEVRVTFKKHK